MSKKKERHRQKLLDREISKYAGELLEEIEQSETKKRIKYALSIPILRTK